MSDELPGQSVRSYDQGRRATIRFLLSRTGCDAASERSWPEFAETAKKCSARQAKPTAPSNGNWRPQRRVSRTKCPGLACQFAVVAPLLMQAAAQRTALHFVGNQQAAGSRRGDERLERRINWPDRIDGVLVEYPGSVENGERADREGVKHDRRHDRREDCYGNLARGLGVRRRCLWQRLADSGWFKRFQAAFR